MGLSTSPLVTTAYRCTRRTEPSWPSHWTSRSCLMMLLLGFMPSSPTPTSHPSRKCFVFEYLALPFGLSSSCKTFNDLVTAFLGFWRRCPLDGLPTRASSYIYDVLGVAASFDSVGQRAVYSFLFPRSLYEPQLFSLCHRRCGSQS